MKTVPVVLASGYSRRFGCDKIMAPLLGKPVILYVLDALNSAGFQDPYVIVRSDQQDLIHAIKSRARIIVNQHAMEGQASAIRAAVSFLCKEAESIMILLGDQPLVRPETIIALLGSFSRDKKDIASCCLGGKPMPPAIFSSACFSELSSLYGDTGARNLLTKDAGRISLIDFTFGWEAEDVDTPDKIGVVEGILRSLL